MICPICEEEHGEGEIELLQSGEEGNSVWKEFLCRKTGLTWMLMGWKDSKTSSDLEVPRGDGPVIDKFVKKMMQDFQPDLLGQDGTHAYSVWMVEVMVQFAYRAGRAHERTAHLLGRRHPSGPSY